MKTCRFCAEAMKPEATVCPHCARRQSRGVATGLVAVLVSLVLLILVGSAISRSREADRQREAVRLEAEADRVAAVLFKQRIFTVAITDGVAAAARRCKRPLAQVQDIMTEGLNARWERVTDVTPTCTADEHRSR